MGHNDTVANGILECKLGDGKHRWININLFKNNETKIHGIVVGSTLEPIGIPFIVDTGAFISYIHETNLKDVEYSIIEGNYGKNIIAGSVLEGRYVRVKVITIGSIKIENAVFQLVPYDISGLAKQAIVVVKTLKLCISGRQYTAIPYILEGLVYLINNCSHMFKNTWNQFLYEIDNNNFISSMTFLDKLELELKQRKLSGLDVLGENILAYLMPKMNYQDDILEYTYNPNVDSSIYGVGACGSASLMTDAEYESLSNAYLSKSINTTHLSESIETSNRTDLTTNEKELVRLIKLNDNKIIYNGRRDVFIHDRMEENFENAYKSLVSKGVITELQKYYTLAEEFSID